MSLINDALKRAKAAQRPTPPAAKVEFRPTHEPAPTPARGSGGLLLAILGLFLVASLIFIRLTSRNATGGKTPGVSSAPETASILPAPPTPRPAAEIVQTAANSSAPLSNVSPKESAAVAPAAIAQNQVSNPVIVEAAPPKPAPKLQAIFFNPTRPSAMINGRTVYVGGKVADGKVIGIDQESVTVLAAGQTNVLTLAQ